MSAALPCQVQCFQDDGVIFLWVTGRAMELGRECLHIWGYEFVQELLWVKTNQLQRIIRTGRTGHWINHSKEHCLIGIKGKPQINNNIDCDVVCAEVRETSRKPDEMYDLLERCAATAAARHAGTAHPRPPPARNGSHWHSLRLPWPAGSYTCTSMCTHTHTHTHTLHMCLGCARRVG